MKWLVVILLLGGVGYLGYASHGKLWGSAEVRACTKLGHLCGDAFRGDGRERCEKGLAELRQAAGAEAVERSWSCISGSDSCAAAAGCMAGAAAGIGLGVGREFLDGLTRSITGK